MSDYLIWFAGAGGFLAVAWFAARASAAEGRRASADRRPAAVSGSYRGIHYRALPGRIEALIDGTVAARFASLDELHEAVDTALEPAD